MDKKPNRPKDLSREAVVKSAHVACRDVVACEPAHRLVGVPHHGLGQVLEVE